MTCGFSEVALTGASSSFRTHVRRLTDALPGLGSHRRHHEPAGQRQVQRRLTADQVEQLITEYRAGADMNEIAASWGVHRTTVAAQLRRASVELRRQGIRADKLADAVRLYNDGWSCQRLAEHYNCDDETVRHALKRASVQLRASWERPR